MISNIFRKNWAISTTANLVIIFLLAACSAIKTKIISSESQIDSLQPLRMAISPYQDTSFLVNTKLLGLEKTYGTKLSLLTLAWDDILPAVASAGNTVDIGYASLTDYLTKSENINRQSNDPVRFIYPIYLVRGTAFITFNANVPTLNSQTISDPQLIKKFLGYRIGAGKASNSQMLLFMLAQKAGIKFSDLDFTDITINDGLLAAENGSLDIAAVGVTQRVEALKQHGRVALSMDSLGVGDINGLVCRESVYKKRKKEIESLIKMQFDCEKYVLSDLDHHSSAMLEYLKASASTHFTLREFKQALANQYFPLSASEVKKEFISNKGKYPCQTNCCGQPVSYEYRCHKIGKGSASDCIHRLKVCSRVNKLDEQAYYNTVNICEKKIRQ